MRDMRRRMAVWTSRELRNLRYCPLRALSGLQNLDQMKEGADSTGVPVRAPERQDRRFVQRYAAGGRKGANTRWPDDRYKT
jgi:hypothetical protein